MCARVCNVLLPVRPVPHFHSLYNRAFRYSFHNYIVVGYLSISDGLFLSTTVRGREEDLGSKVTLSYISSKMHFILMVNDDKNPIGSKMRDAACRTLRLV